MPLYFLIALHFLRKLSRKIIPSKGVKYMVTALHPNHIISGYGVIRENTLVILMANPSSTIPRLITQESYIWTTMHLPVDELVSYARKNGIAYVLPLWIASSRGEFEYHGAPSAVSHLYAKLQQMHEAMESYQRNGIHNKDAKVDATL